MSQVMIAEQPANAPVFSQQFINLADQRLGSKVVAVSDDFFAAADRMLNHLPAEFYPDKYDDNGKWMDGWESRRRRDSGHDWSIVKLGVAGSVKGLQIDTSFFTGNYAPAISIEVCHCESDLPASDTQWQALLPASALSADNSHFFEVSTEQAISHVRVNIFPDGGIARLRIFGQPAATANSDQRIDLIALKNGGRVVGFNDAHYGTPSNLLAPGKGVNMGDGWETRRRREPGNDWCIIALGQAGSVEDIDIATTHFKGNFPDKLSIQAANISDPNDLSLISQSMFWEELLAPQTLSADNDHHFSELKPLGSISHIRVNIFPDGGISRVRLWGKVKGNN
ncbi:allantoicase [Agarivorans sp. 1_MG-2023]|uniref:allantoicase n=1 Tax=Agarivorans sp. 1_MG-2023 TaxID=3062634 RepID=UPI0026E23A40|nr:allantoicase [Agarivorans sp. 1_MG-2023]MDO6765654.1 allantoicase [Agarivorans sp. 1_MG-2023]